MYDLCKDGIMTFCEAYSEMLAGKKISGITWESKAYVYLKDENMLLRWANGDEFPWSPQSNQITRDEYITVEGFLSEDTRDN